MIKRLSANVCLAIFLLILSTSAQGYWGPNEVKQLEKTQNTLNAITEKCNQGPNANECNLLITPIKTLIDACGGNPRCTKTVGFVSNVLIDSAAEFLPWLKPYKATIKGTMPGIFGKNISNRQLLEEIKLFRKLLEEHTQFDKNKFKEITNNELRELLTEDFRSIANEKTLNPISTFQKLRARQSLYSSAAILVSLYDPELAIVVNESAVAIDSLITSSVDIIVNGASLLNIATMANGVAGFVSLAVKLTKQPTEDPLKVAVRGLHEQLKTISNQIGAIDHKLNFIRNDLTTIVSLELQTQEQLIKFGEHLVALDKKISSKLSNLEKNQSRIYEILYEFAKKDLRNGYRKFDLCKVSYEAIPNSEDPILNSIKNREFAICTNHALTIANDLSTNEGLYTGDPNLIDISKLIDSTEIYDHPEYWLSANWREAIKVVFDASDDGLYGRMVYPPPRKPIFNDFATNFERERLWEARSKAVGDYYETLSNLIEYGVGKVTNPLVWYEGVKRYVNMQNNHSSDLTSNISYANSVIASHNSNQIQQLGEDMNTFATKIRETNLAENAMLLHLYNGHMLVRFLEQRWHDYVDYKRHRFTTCTEEELRKARKNELIDKSCTSEWHYGEFSNRELVFDYWLSDISARENKRKSLHPSDLLGMVRLLRVANSEIEPSWEITKTPDVKFYQSLFGFDSQEDEQYTEIVKDPHSGNLYIVDSKVYRIIFRFLSVYREVLIARAWGESPVLQVLDYFSNLSTEDKISHIRAVFPGLANITTIPGSDIIIPPSLSGLIPPELRFLFGLMVSIDLAKKSREDFKLFIQKQGNEVELINQIAQSLYDSKVILGTIPNNSIFTHAENAIFQFPAIKGKIGVNWSGCIELKAEHRINESSPAFASEKLKLCKKEQNSKEDPRYDSIIADFVSSEGFHLDLASEDKDKKVCEIQVKNIAQDALFSKGGGIRDIGVGSDLNINLWEKSKIFFEKDDITDRRFTTARRNPLIAKIHEGTLVFNGIKLNPSWDDIDPNWDGIEPTYGEVLSDQYFRLKIQNGLDSECQNDQREECQECSFYMLWGIPGNNSRIPIPSDFFLTEESEGSVYIDGHYHFPTNISSEILNDSDTKQITPVNYKGPLLTFNGSEDNMNWLLNSSNLSKLVHKNKLVKMFLYVESNLKNAIKTPNSGKSSNVEINWDEFDRALDQVMKEFVDNWLFKNMTTESNIDWKNSASYPLPAEYVTTLYEVLNRLDQSWIAVQLLSRITAGQCIKSPGGANINQTLRGIASGEDVKHFLESKTSKYLHWSELLNRGLLGVSSQGIEYDAKALKNKFGRMDKWPLQLGSMFEITQKDAILITPVEGAVEILREATIEAGYMGSQLNWRTPDDGLRKIWSQFEQNPDGTIQFGSLSGDQLTNWLNKNQVKLVGSEDEEKFVSPILDETNQFGLLSGDQLTNWLNKNQLNHFDCKILKEYSEHLYQSMDFCRDTTEREKAVNPPEACGGNDTYSPGIISIKDLINNNKSISICQWQESASRRWNNPLPDSYFEIKNYAPTPSLSNEASGVPIAWLQDGIEVSALTFAIDNLDINPISKDSIKTKVNLKALDLLLDRTCSPGIVPLHLGLKKLDQLAE